MSCQEERPPAVADGTKITIGEALEAAALSAGDQPVEPSDAAAIEAAEARAAGRLQDDDDDDDDADAAAAPAGLAARARAAADANARAERDEDKTTLGDVLAVRFALLSTSRTRAGAAR